MALSGYLEKQFARWLDRRIPAHRQMKLNQRRIFIFPSRQGAYFIIVLLLLLLAAINYQNNMAYVLTFFLASMVNTAILLTYLNVSGLRLKAGKTYSVFAGDHAEFEVLLSRDDKRLHQNLRLYWPGNPPQVYDLVNQDHATARLHSYADQRGRFRPGRLLVESFYPIGLLRCWSWVDLDFEVIIYPKPVMPASLPTVITSGKSGREKPMTGNEDFWGFRDYIKGEPLRHVDWRSLAKGQRLQSKIYAAKEDERTWVDWQALPGYGTEERLSLMCGWVLLLEKGNKAYGLKMPGIEISPDSGEKHRHRVLSALALYGWGE